jgi:hypothetical protein
MTDDHQQALGDDDQVWAALETLDRSRAAHYARTGEYRTLTDHERAERCRAYVRKMPGAISGAGGHDATYKVARVIVHDFGIHPEPGFWILADWNANCDPPWGDADLIHKLWSAYRSRSSRGDRPRGWRLTEDRPGPRR